MNRIKYKILFLFGLITFTVKSQSYSVSPRSPMEEHFFRREMDMMGRINPEPIEGSPYLIDSFVRGDIITTKAIYKNIPVRYNIYKDYLEFMDGSVRYILDPDKDLKKVEWPGKALIVQPYDDNGKIRLGFFELIHDADILLLKKYAIKLMPMQQAAALESHTHPATYKVLPAQFYYRIPNTASHPIYSVKKMVAEFPDEKKALFSMIKRKHIKANEDDLIELWAYYKKLKKS